MKSHAKVISLSMLILINVAIVANVQAIVACATYGYKVLPYYFIALLTFFIPCIFITAHLATAYPKTGAAFHWMQLAFGKKTGFIGISLIWLANVLWYPVGFSFVAAGIAYLLNPHWSQSNDYMIGMTLIIYWSVTGLNILGIQLSSLGSSLMSLFGIIFPIILIITCGILWWHWNLPRQIHFSWQALLPHINNSSNLGFLIAVLTTLFGIEMTTAHAENVIHPEKNFPRALFISGFIVLIILLGAELTIALIVPYNKISLVSGLLDALTLFFQSTPFIYLTGAIIFLILLGNIGSMMAWMFSSSRGIREACRQLELNSFLQLSNSKDAPIGILCLEGFIFTLICGVYLLFPTVNQSYWFLLDLASQISLVYYCILFLSALWIYQKSRHQPGAWTIPGGMVTLIVCVVLGIVSMLAAIGVGFIPPTSLGIGTLKQHLFQVLLTLGILSAITFPFILLSFKKARTEPLL